MCFDRGKVIFTSHLEQVVVLSMRIHWESVMF